MNSIDAVGGMGTGGLERPKNSSLTDAQKQTAQEIISRYDPSSMTEESAEAMRQELIDAGIEPGDDLFGILEEGGFEMKGPDGPKEGPPPPPPPEEPSSVEESEDDSTITDFLEKYRAGEASEEDLNEFISFLRENGISTAGVVVNKQV